MKAAKAAEKERDLPQVEALSIAAPRYCPLLDSFVECDPESPAKGLTEHVHNALCTSPQPSKVADACTFWREIIGELFVPRRWGNFVFDHMAIPDSEQSRTRQKDFELALFALEKVETVVRGIRDAAFEIDPSARDGLYNCASLLVKDVSRTVFILQDIVLARVDGLDYMERGRRALMFDFQQAADETYS